jgi:hypothetical protein
MGVSSMTSERSSAAMVAIVWYGVVLLAWFGFGLESE